MASKDFFISFLRSDSVKQWAEFLRRAWGQRGQHTSPEPHRTASPALLHSIFVLPIHPQHPKKALFWNRLLKLPLTLWCVNRLRIIITLKVKKSHLASSKIKQSSLFPYFRCTSVCTTSTVIVLRELLRYWKRPILSLVDPDLRGGQHELLRAHQSQNRGSISEQCCMDLTAIIRFSPRKHDLSSFQFL